MRIDLDPATPDSRKRLLRSRLATGLFQGLTLYGLHEAGKMCVWPSTDPRLHGSLYLATLILPVLLLVGLGHLPATVHRRWASAAAILLLAIGWTNVERQVQEGLQAPFVSTEVVPLSAIALFILLQWPLAGERDRRWVASYPQYFDTAWHSGVQLLLSACFVGGLWALLVLGGALFDLIGFQGFGQTIREAWFSIPVSTLTFALALHLTDAMATAIRGIQTLLHLLLSWLLPVIAALSLVFLLLLPFVGIEELSRHASATTLMLSAVACLVLLTNATYMDGTSEQQPPAFLRLTTIAASLLLLPMAVIAIWGLAERIDQHGLTPARIFAAGCALLGAIYAFGYGLAAVGSLRGRPWMKALERSNLIAALSAVVLILLSSTPVLDPLGLSVTDQMRRLRSGVVEPAAFDFGFLKFRAGQAGIDALTVLRESNHPEIARRANEASEATNEYRYGLMQEGPAAPNVTVLSREADFPDDFLDGLRFEDPPFRCPEPGQCFARAHDMDSDGTPEVLVATEHVVFLYQRSAVEGVSRGAWSLLGQWTVSNCTASSPFDWLRAGSLDRQPGRWPDLIIGGQRIGLSLRSSGCGYVGE